MLETAETRPELRILAAAGRQHGLVTTAQLLAPGWSKDVIAGRVRTGWLRRVHYGVYLVGPLATEHTVAMAAVLATGSVGSHYPAAVLWALRPAREGPIDVTTPRKLHNRQAGLQRRVSPRSLKEQFRRYPHHRGTAALRKATETGPHLTRSDLERIALGLIRRARLPEPETNVRVEGYEVDLLWRDHGLIVEVDSWAFHSVRSSFEQDRRRDQRLTTAGYRVIRVTDCQLTNEPELVAATLTRALALPR